MNSKLDVEDLKIYKQYLYLIYYTEMILEKYPKKEKLSLVTNIKNETYSGLKNILIDYKVYDENEKLKHLNNLDINLKMIKVFIRISHKRKYINHKNYEAWSKKLNNIGALLGGWINSCLRQ